MMKTESDIDALVEKFEGPKHALSGRLALLVPLVAFTWSAWQLWIASPFPFQFGIGIFVDLPARGLHLAFGLLLGFLMFPSAWEAAKAWRNGITLALGVPPPPYALTAGSPMTASSAATASCWRLPPAGSTSRSKRFSAGPESYCCSKPPGAASASPWSSCA